MPMLIPLIAAGAEIWAGAAAVAAAETAGAAVIGGMMVAGGALTVVGTLTGNQNLTKYGSLLGLAGGVAGLANGAWASTAGNAIDQASTAGNSVNQMDIASDVASGNATTQLGQTATATSPTANDLANLSQATSTATASPAVPTAGAPQPGLLAANAPPSATSPFAPTDASASMAAPGAPSTSPGAIGDASVPPPDPGVAPSSPGVTGVAPPDPGVTPPNPGVNASGAPPATPSAVNDWGMNTYAAGNPAGNTVQASQGFWGNLGDKGQAFAKWAKANPELAKTVGGMATGFGNNLSQQTMQQRQFDLQQQAITAQRARFTNSLAGVTVPRYQAPVKGP